MTASLLNQMLPNRLAQSILHKVCPKWKDACGCKAYYQGGYYPQMPAQLEASGFEIERIEYRYCQAIYLKLFLPLYLLFVIYDLFVYSFRIRILACQLLVLGRKRDSLEAVGESR